MLELDGAEVPVPDADHPQPWTLWRNRLGQRRLGLIPVADPARFDWPGADVLGDGEIRVGDEITAG
jgi:hypothetical protein